MNPSHGYSEGAEVPEDKTTDNELIAQFMGGFNYDQQTRHIGANLPFRLNEWSDYKDMQYQTSWAWLMPVVGKISKTKPMNQAWFDVKYHLLSADIKVVYRRVVEFIKWYNLESLKNKPI